MDLVRGHHVKTVRWRSGQNRPTASGTKLFYPACGSAGKLVFCSPASWTSPQHMPVVLETIEHNTDRGGIHTAMRQSSNGGS